MRQSCRLAVLGAALLALGLLGTAHATALKTRGFKTPIVNAGATDLNKNRGLCLKFDHDFLVLRTSQFNSIATGLCLGFTDLVEDNVLVLTQCDSSLATLSLVKIVPDDNDRSKKQLFQLKAAYLANFEDDPATSALCLAATEAGNFDLAPCDIADVAQQFIVENNEPGFTIRLNTADKAPKVCVTIPSPITEGSEITAELCAKEFASRQRLFITSLVENVKENIVFQLIGDANEDGVGECLTVGATGADPAVVTEPCSDPILLGETFVAVKVTDGKDGSSGDDDRSGSSGDDERSDCDKSGPWFLLRNANVCLEIVDDGTNNARQDFAPLRIATCEDGNLFQQFTFLADGHIIVRGSGKCLRQDITLIEGDDAEDGNIDQVSCAADPEQIWEVDTLPVRA